VKFFGFLDKPTLTEFYNAGEALGIASTSETQGLVMMQAFACGIPVIGVNALSLPEYINHDNGFVVPPNDPEAFAEKMVYLLQNPDAAQKLGASARTYVEQFSAPAIAEKWEELYREAIKIYNAK
jgi:1,2-diacylglycerol 3-alpha-glucosyltransferase